MKKLLIVSLLLLALVFTVVACTGDTGDTTDTTAAETVGATEEPTAAPTDADEETTVAEEPTQAPDPDVTTAPEEEPTKAPETTAKPQVTEEPEKPTEPPVTEPVDPMAPINVFGPEALANLDRPNYIESATVSEDGKYITFVPNAADPHYYPFANVEGGRYIAIKYRSPNAEGTAVQLYIGSMGTGPTDDTSMLRLTTIADGEWHVALFDTQALIDAGIYDGSTVSYFRFDPLECDYMLDENGETYKTDDGVWARYPMPEGAYIDVQYIAFFHTPEAAEMYEIAPLFIAGPADMAASATNMVTVTDNGDYATADGNFEGSNGDGWFLPLNGASVPGTFISVMYRSSSEALIPRCGEFFAGSGAGAVDGSSTTFNYVVDGAWHHAVVDTAGHPDMTGNMAYIRYDFCNDTRDIVMDIAYVAVFDSAEKAEAYYAYKTRVPEDTHNFTVNAADETGTGIAGSTLSSVFAFTQAAAGPSPIENGAYVFKDFTEAIATPDGAYAYTANIPGHGTQSLSAMFVRGVYNFNFGDGGYFGVIWENGAGEGNTNYCGSGGIYLLPTTDADGNVTLNIRFNCWDGSAVSFKEYNVPVASTKITVVDNGTTVSIFSEDVLAAVVTISGTKDFGFTGQNGAVVNPEDCAASVTIQTAEIKEVVENAVVASTHLSHIGLATRAGGGSLTVTEVSLLPASSATIPAFPEAPVDPLVVDKTEYDVGEAIKIFATGSGKDWIGIANRGASESIGWYYVEPISGQTVNFFDHAQDGAGNPLRTLPAGEYTVYLIPNDEALASATPIAAIDITISAPDPHSLPIWNGNDGKLTHISHDVVRWENGSQAGAGVNTGNAVIGDATTMLYAGWVGALQEIASFGYKIGDNDVVWNDGWVNGAEQGVIDAAASTGAKYAARFGIPADVSGIKGTQTISFLYKSIDGVVVCLTRFDLIGAADLTQAPAWDADKSVVTHQSFDELRINGAGGVFTPGVAAGWDNIANLGADAASLYYWGWIGAKGELGQFGYQIDDNAPVFDAGFAVGADGPVVDAAAGTGADIASRMGITIDIAALEGEHTVYVFYKSADGTVVKLNQFTVIKPVPAPAIDPADALYPMLNGTYYVVDGYTALYTVTFTVTGEGAGTIAVNDATYNWTYTTAGGFVADAENLSVGLNRVGQLVFQCTGLPMPQELVTEIPEEPVTPAVGDLVLGDNAVDVQNTMGEMKTFVAPSAGTYVFSFAAGEENGDIGMETDYGSDWISLPYEVTLEAGQSITLIIATLDWNTDIIDIVITDKAATPDEPVVTDWTVDLSTLPGVQYDWTAAGISGAYFKLGYSSTVALGEVDLSKYSAVKIAYCCDGSQITADNFAAASCLAIGLKSENSSYGQVTDDNFTGDIAHTDMVFSTNGWGSGIRDAVVDLSAVDYNGNVWVTVHNPAGTEIAITGIQFIA